VLKRIQIDIGTRIAREHLLQFGDAFLLLKEPSFRHLERVSGLTGISTLAKELLGYAGELSEELILDVVGFTNDAPLEIIQTLLAICRELFKCSEDIEAIDFEQQGYAPLLEGTLRGWSIKAVKARKIEELDQLKMEIFKGLGVYIQAEDPALASLAADDEAPRSKMWMPLTMAINPEGYSDVKKSLVWTGESAAPVDKAPKSEAEEKETPDPRHKDPTSIPLTKVMSRAQYVKFINELGQGFLAVKDKMSAGTYRETWQKGLDPRKLDDRSRLLLNQPAQEEYTIKSRWKGKKPSETN
jgi:hypothetical protein